MVLKGQSRELVLRLHNYFEKESRNGGPLVPMTHVRDRVTAALGIGNGIVSKITKEHYGSNGMEQHKLSSPNKKRLMPHKVTAVDSFDADAIRRHIYDYYERKEYPTLKKLTVSLRDCGLFHG